MIPFDHITLFSFFIYLQESCTGETVRRNEWKTSANFRELTVNHLTQNYLWHPAQKGAADQTARESFLFFPFTATSEATVTSGCRTKKQEKGKKKKRHLLYSAKNPHGPPTHCLHLPGLFYWSALRFITSYFCTEFPHEVLVHRTAPCTVLWTRSVISWTGPNGEKREVTGNGILGQLVRVKLGTGRGGRWGNSSGSSIPSAHRTISGAARGRPKQELIRGGRENKESWLGQNSRMESKGEVSHGDLLPFWKLKYKHLQWEVK